LTRSAVWRRFESIIRFPLPTQQDRVLLLRLFFGGFDHSQLNLTALSRRTKNATGADLERIAVETARRALLDGRNVLLTSDIEPSMAAFRERLIIERGLTPRKEAMSPMLDDSTFEEAHE